MTRHIVLRRVDSEEETTIYAVGRFDPAAFLTAVRQEAESILDDADQVAALTPDHVRHARFRPISPTEARAQGFDYGVVEAEPGRYGYDVTEVTL